MARRKLIICDCCGKEIENFISIKLSQVNTYGGQIGYVQPEEYYDICLSCEKKIKKVINEIKQ